MRTPTDALRSVARYVAVAVGDDWEVRPSQERGVFNRPYARIAQVPSLQMVTQRWDVSKLLTTFNILLYPALGADADASHLEAMRVADVMWTAFAGPGVGSPVVRTPVDSHRGRPYRVPLYDYDGIALGEPADETRRDPRDFLHVEAAPEIQTFIDPQEERAYTLAANIRMSWLRSAAVPSGAPTVQTVTSGAQPHD